MTNNTQNHDTDAIINIIADTINQSQPHYIVEHIQSMGKNATGTEVNLDDYVKIEDFDSMDNESLLDVILEITKTGSNVDELLSIIKEWQDIYTNKMATMNRAEMQQNEGFVSLPTGVIIGESGFPLNNTNGEQVYLDLSDDEINADLLEELTKVFLRDYNDYVSDNGLISVRPAYGMGQFVSVEGYVSMLEERLGAEFGVLESFLTNVIAPLDEEYTPNRHYRIDEPNKPFDNYIEKKIRTWFPEYIDPNGNVKLRNIDNNGSISLPMLIEMVKGQLIEGIQNRTEVLNEDADYINEKYPVSPDVEIPLSQDPVEFLKPLNSNITTEDTKRALYVKIQSSARHSERNLVSLAILPVAQSLASGEIQTDANPSFKNQMRMALEIVNNDLLVGVIPDYVKTAVLSMDTASRLQKSINDKKIPPAENGISYEVSNIIWDADDMNDISHLSTSMIVNTPSKIIDEEDIEEYIANFITDETGFTHDGFSSSRMGEAYEEQLQRQTGLADNWTAEDANGFQHDDITSDTIDGLMDEIEAWYHDDKTRDDYQDDLEAHIIDDTITIGTYMFSLYNKEKQHVEDIFTAKETEEYISLRLLKRSQQGHGFVNNLMSETIEMARDDLQAISQLREDLKDENSIEEMAEMAEQLINEVENTVIDDGVSKFSADQIIDRINMDFELRPYKYTDTLVSETSLFIFNSIEEADFLVNKMIKDGYSKSSIDNFLISLTEQVEMLGDQPGADHTAYEVLHHLEALSLSLKSNKHKVAVINLNVNNYFEPYKMDSEGNIDKDESGVPIFKTEDDILDELRDVDFGDNYVSDSYDESSVLISEITLDSNGLPDDIVTSSNINLEYHFPLTMSYEDIEEACADLELPGNYVEDTYELKTIIVEDSPYIPTDTVVSEVDDEVMGILENKTKTVVADLELMHFFDPSMTEDEMTIELENMELPPGYKEDSFKVKRFKENGQDQNGVQIETSAIVGVQIEFVFPATESYEDLRYDVEVFCKKNINSEYRITGLFDSKYFSIANNNDSQPYDIEKSFEDPWHEYHGLISNFATLIKRGKLSSEQEKQLSTAKDTAMSALWGLINATEEMHPEALIELASLYEFGVRAEFRDELGINEGTGDFQAEMSKNERDAKVKKYKMAADNEILRILNQAYTDARDLEAALVSNPDEIFELLLKAAEGDFMGLPPGYGHVPAMFAVAEMYRTGHGVDTSEENYEKWQLLAQAGLDTGRVVYNRATVSRSVVARPDKKKRNV